MKRQMISSVRFSEAAAAGPDAVSGLAVFRLAPAEIDLTQVDDRVVRYVFSTSAVARDRNTINPNGWDFSGFDNYRSFLWAHDDQSPPIGNVIEHSVRGIQLIGAVRYVERDIYPFADMIFQMVKRSIVSAVSVSWLPLEWKWSTDKDRQGGIDFLRQDMLEISQVPVPAQPTAIATARAMGIDTSPMVEWAEKILDGGGMVMVPRAQLEILRREAKMPAPNKPASVALSRSSTQRGLYTVGSLADILSYLMSTQANVAWETEFEGDGSDIGARLLAVAKQLGQILVDATLEEINELFATGEDGETDTVFLEVIEAAAKSPAQRALTKLGLLSRKMKEAEDTPEKHLSVAQLRAAMREELNAFTRAGRVLSAKNETDLTTARDLIDGVVAQVAADDKDETRAVLIRGLLKDIMTAFETPKPTAEASPVPVAVQAAADTRVRKARALKLKK